MAKKQKRKNNISQSNTDARTVIVKSLTGSAVCVALFFSVLAVVALICFKNDTDSEKYKIIVPCIGAFSAFLGGYIAVRPIRRHGLILGCASAFVPFIIILAIAIVAGQAGMSATAWITLAGMLAAASVGGVLAVNKRK